MAKPTERPHNQTATKKSSGKPASSAESYTHEDVISAVNHVLRRQILRLLHKPDGPRSPVKAAKRLDHPLSNVSYHFKVLLGRKVIDQTKTVPVRGAVEHVYISLVADDPVVTGILERTRKDDEVQCRR